MAQVQGKVEAKKVNTVIIGAGLQGIALGVRLKSLGFDDFVMLDPAPIMGNWRRLTKAQALKTLRSDGMSHIHPEQNGFADFLVREKQNAESPAPLDHFNRFTWQTIGDFDLMSNFIPGRVEAIESNGVYTVTAQTMDGNTRFDTQRVVVAIGPGVPNMPSGDSFEQVVHSDVFSIQEFKRRFAKGYTGNPIAIIGAGLTAGTLAVQIAEIVAREFISTFAARSAPRSSRSTRRGSRTPPCSTHSAS